MIALGLLSVLGLTCVALSGHLLDDRAAEGKTDGKSGIVWGDALIFLLCLAGTLHARKREREESDE